MRGLRSIALLVVVLLTAGVGSAGAAALVTGRQIQDGTVTGADLRRGSLTGRDVRDGSLTPGDLRGLPAGPTGDTGPPGPPGTSGIAGTTYRTAVETVPAGSRLSWLVACEEGETALGGGVATTRPDAVVVIRSFPDGFHWYVGIENTAAVPVRAEGWVVCLRLPAPREPDGGSS